ncbi:hypothetical protein SAMN05216338_104956 [Bradyrhizobium sp. Rc2d]|uniref:hypothetical protein n=1 Tax=Bradyrhizobium sp. Rc2d TaxID=1855321 RepID=UPI0008845502|nr:hypothetical protein [Bradyrhizobium sp. Rc2d]SDJ43385.1 hypothetical protein SAMN05216338_104956 [Bradyrhizobium sp. Rc2d]
MAARLGNVLYWIGNILLVLTILVAATVAVTMIRSDNPNDVNGAPYVGAGIAIAGLIPYLLGRACRYVLAGRF